MLPTNLREQLIAALVPYDALDILQVLEEAYTIDGQRGVAAELLRAARAWLDGSRTGVHLPPDPVIDAAFKVVRDLERAEKAARLQEAGAL
jgi:hypothetical protein